VINVKVKFKTYVKISAVMQSGDFSLKNVAAGMEKMIK